MKTTHIICLTFLVISILVLFLPYYLPLIVEKKKHKPKRPTVGPESTVSDLIQYHHRYALPWQYIEHHQKVSINGIEKEYVVYCLEMSTQPDTDRGVQL